MSNYVSNRVSNHRPLNVYGIQITNHQILTLPVSIGTLWAHLSTQEDIFPHLKLLGLSITFKDSVLEIVDQIAAKGEPDIILLSLYMWNRNRSNKLTKAIKLKWPKVKIIVGGNEIPQVPERFYEFASENPQYDYYVSGEGEIPLENIMRLELHMRGFGEFSFDKKLFGHYSDGQVQIQAQRSYLTHKEELDPPSPAKMGIYDELAKEHRDRELEGVLETNRGCPYSCTFCDWGTRERLRRFSMKRIRDDIDWMVENVKEMMIADPNFGILERDLEIAEYLIQQVNNNPRATMHSANITYSKTHKENVLKIAEVLEKNDLTRSGASFSLQSLNEPTLKAIKRNNLAIYKNLEWAVENFIKRGMPYYTELIMGLPEETKESFLEGMERVLNYFPFELHLYKLAILENSEMRLADHNTKYGMRWSRWTAGPSKFEDEEEYTYLIQSTNTMSNQDMEYVATIRDFIQLFWFGKWTYYIQIYLKQNYDIPIVGFWRELFDHIKESQDPYWLAILGNMKTDNRYYPFSAERPFQRFTNAWIYLASDLRQKALFYEKLKSYCRKKYPQLDWAILGDLFYFNERMLADGQVQLRREFSTEWNWTEYFQTESLLREQVHYSFEIFKLGIPEYPVSIGKKAALFYLGGGHEYIFNKQNAFLYQRGVVRSARSGKLVVNRVGRFFTEAEKTLDSPRRDFYFTSIGLMP